MEKLPSEIRANIFSGLPIVSHLQCREVCKTWETLLPKPKMGLLHVEEINFEAEFYFSELNNEDKVSTNHVDEQLRSIGTLTISRNLSVSKSFMVGSCNGLVCYAQIQTFKFFVIRVYIWNPVTKEHIELPRVTFWRRWDSSDKNPAIGFGFGYNRVSNEYKVVILRGNDDRDVQVYTLPQVDNVWRSIRGTDKHPLFPLSILPSTGVFAGGALHWIDQQDSTKPTAVAFDLEYETFDFLPSLPVVSHGAKHVSFVVLGGNLCVLEVVPSKDVMIWELNYRKTFKYALRSRKTVKHTEEQPWIPKFRLAWEDYSWFESFALRKSDKCLLWYNAVISCYDPETKTLRNLDDTLMKFVSDSTPSVYTTNRAIPHWNSLVSLKAIMERRSGKKRKAQKELE